VLVEVVVVVGGTVVVVGGTVVVELLPHLPFGTGGQPPPLHTSVVHGSPSSAQGFVLLVKMHPCVGSQVPVTHGSLLSQVSGAPGVQRPARQVSGPLQTFRSPHGVPSATGGCVHVPPLHTSLVHGFPSSAHVLVLLVKVQLPVASHVAV